MKGLDLLIANYLINLLVNYCTFISAQIEANEIGERNAPQDDARNGLLECW